MSERREEGLRGKENRGEGDEKRVVEGCRRRVLRKGEVGREGRGGGGGEGGSSAEHFHPHNSLLIHR